jgi:hypothetical protein
MLSPCSLVTDHTYCGRAGGLKELVWCLCQPSITTTASPKSRQQRVRDSLRLLLRRGRPAAAAAAPCNQPPEHNVRQGHAQHSTPSWCHTGLAHQHQKARRPCARGVLLRWVRHCRGVSECATRPGAFARMQSCAVQPFQVHAAASVVPAAGAWQQQTQYSSTSTAAARRKCGPNQPGRASGCDPQRRLLAALTAAHQEATTPSAAAAAAAAAAAVQPTQWVQRQVTLPAYKRGCHVVTRKLLAELPEVAEFETGLANLFSELDGDWLWSGGRQSEQLFELDCRLPVQPASLAHERFADHQRERVARRAAGPECESRRSSRLAAVCQRGCMCRVARLRHAHPQAPLAALRGLMRLLLLLQHPTCAACRMRWTGWPQRAATTGTLMRGRTTCQHTSR